MKVVENYIYDLLKVLIKIIRENHTTQRENKQLSTNYYNNIGFGKKLFRWFFCFKLFTIHKKINIKNKLKADII